MAHHDPTHRLHPIEIEYLPPSALVADPCNARKHSQGQLERLKRSLQEFGCIVPILIADANQILAGHARVLAAIALGLPQVPAIRARRLADTHFRAYMLADNRLADSATWDDALLAEPLLELSEMDLTFAEDSDSDLD